MINVDDCLLFLLLFILLACAGFIQGKPSNPNCRILAWQEPDQTLRRENRIRKLCWRGHIVVQIGIRICNTSGVLRPRTHQVFHVILFWIRSVTSWTEQLLRHQTLNVAFTLIEFIDWRYSQSCWYFRPSCKLFPVCINPMAEFIDPERELKVHKRENFLGFDFEICTFS